MNNKIGKNKQSDISRILFQPLENIIVPNKYRKGNPKSGLLEQLRFCSHPENALCSMLSLYLSTEKEFACFPIAYPVDL